jgi:predicted CXXCH cytochrome family protein
VRNSILIRSAVVTLFAVIAVAAGAHSMRTAYTGTRAGKTDENYISSTDCRVCHEEQYSTWRRTHHSRMTQDISPETVQGDFTSNNTYEYQGVSAKMERRPSGFFMEFRYPDGKTETYKIERTVGSRRIEQYVAKLDGQYYRLPVAYDLVYRRWISLNGSFFYPDGGDFKQHFTQWDTNCVFCHNVKAQPNFDFSTRRARTEVAELGIACGACHGQGAEHADQASSPLTRASWHLGGKPRKIVHPLELDSDRAMMVCGHCHGQRVPEPESRIRDILAGGDPYDAGEDLSQFYRPVHMETKVGNFSFANRFWNDGSPRLTAYEYQGMLASPCFVRGKPGDRISCMTCHTMHGGDVKGQITEEKRTNAACNQCHTEFADPAVLALHTKHGPASSGSSCYSCHMPEVIYGIQAFHKSHQIAVPDPRLTIRRGVPNACNQCHVDRSVNWVMDQVKTLWPARYSEALPSMDPQFDLAETVRGLFAGDALTRALMADALSRRGEPVYALPYLIEAFETDNYPIVRYFAANGLAASGVALPKPDYLASAEQRKMQIAPWLERASVERMNEARRLGESLRKLRRDVDLEVGE